MVSFSIIKVNFDIILVYKKDLLFQDVGKYYFFGFWEGDLGIIDFKFKVVQLILGQEVIYIYGYKEL